jgi:hypothetical protein
MSNQQPKHPWKIDANDRYQKVITTITGLAVASLILPTVFLRDFLGIKEGTPLIKYLSPNPVIYACWLAWILSIVGGIAYGYGYASEVGKASMGERTEMAKEVGK